MFRSRRGCVFLCRSWHPQAKQQWTTGLKVHLHVQFLSPILVCDLVSYDFLKISYTTSIFWSCWKKSAFKYPAFCQTYWMVDAANSDDEIGRVNASLHFYLIIGSVTFAPMTIFLHILYLLITCPTIKKSVWVCFIHQGLRTILALALILPHIITCVGFSIKIYGPSLLLTPTSFYVKNSI